MATAYSYLRFSSPQQAAGDSIRRQIENREKWLAAHPKMRLDTSLTLTDAGRSAFRRKAWDTYALARFVECIKSGRVEPGSYLLVENLDRLSRDHVGDATELFLSIVNKGVTIVQLSPAVMEFRQPVDVMPLIFAIFELSRGHSESAIKSERGLASWKEKQAAAAMQIVTCKLPGWIKCEGRDKVGKRVINEGKLVLDEAGAKAVRQIFALASDGYGASTIAQRLNAENVPVLGRKEIAARGQAHFPPDERKKRPVVWSGAVVWHILKSRATIGEYIPYGRRKDGSVGTAVPDYFPAVIDADTFHAVNGAIQTRGRVGHGRRGKHVNLFAGLLRDARDDGSLSYWHTGTHDPVLISVNAKEGRGVRWVSFPAKVFEEAILSRLVEIKPSDIWGDGGNKAAKKVAAIADRIAKNESLAKLWTSKMDNPDTVDLVAAKLAELIAERKALAAEQEEAQRELASPISESWGEFATLAGLLKSDQSDELRLRFRSSLRRTIQEIHCLFVKQGYTSLAAVQVNFAKDEGRRNYLIISRRPTVNGTARTPVRWWAGSIKHPDDDLPFEKEDLRNPDEAAGVEAFLKAYPRDMIDKLLSGKPARKPARR